MSPEIEHAYRLLEVTPSVSDKEMRTAWRKLVRRYHPDLAKTDPKEASRRMGEINSAFDALAHHRSAPPQPQHPKPRAAQPTQRTANRKKETPRARAAHTAHSQKAAGANPDAQDARASSRQTALKATAKWSRQEQRLVEAACAMFEETRRKLNSAARRPTVSVCH